jgi:hypothetical protein
MCDVVTDAGESFLSFSSANSAASAVALPTADDAARSRTVRRKAGLVAQVRVCACVCARDVTTCVQQLRDVPEPFVCLVSASRAHDLRCNARTQLDVGAAVWAGECCVLRNVVWLICTCIV